MDNILTVDFKGNGDFPDGLTFVCDGNFCEVTYMDITQKYNNNSLPEEFLPVVLYDFLKTFPQVIPTEGYDDNKNCDYIKRTVNNSFVTFEVYNTGEIPAYCIVVT